MQTFRRILSATLAVMLCAPAAFAQQTHVVNQSALDQAVQQRVTQDQADRDAIRSFLQNPQVKSVAAKAGLARAVNKDLAGGATVVITTTTIILILLVIIIIIALVK